MNIRRIRKQIQNCIAVLFFLSVLEMTAKDMPSNMVVSDDGRQLHLAQQAESGFYDIEKIETIELEFANSDWKQRLAANYISKTDIPADLTYKGEVYPNVGIRYRGQTSYMRLGNSDKKSFNLSLDFVDENQRIGDYKTINLLNCFDDPSFIKEALFTSFTGQTIPAAKSNFVKLIINGESWGIYYNIQQLNSSFYEDWFVDGDGVNWRAEYPDTSTAKLHNGSARFGAGFCSLNFLSSNPIVYQRYYTLKSSSSDDPWYQLMLSTEKLNTLPSDMLYDSLKNYLDVDRSLWHIANEIIFADDDGYVNKGGMDYYVFYDMGTNRLNPIEYDGNSTFMSNKITFPMFFRSADVRFPLINKLMSNPELMQRYIAHIRTITNNYLDTGFSFPKVRFFKELIEEEVLSDTKKIYSNSEFYKGITDIQTFIKGRFDYITNQQFFNDEVPLIETVNTVESSEDKSVTLKVKASHSMGLSKVILYHGGGLQGVFSKILMQKQTEGGEEYYTARIPSYPAGSYVRYYVEAIADDNVKTAAYMPEGAEHDVFYYQIEAEIAENSDVVINELMAKNSNTIADPQGEYDDWIELFNKGTNDVNLGGKYLTDKIDNHTKWQFPENTIIRAGEYLIVWADENGKATPGLHANFKLSGSGELVMLIDSDANGNQILDSVNFGPQQDDISFGRLPNGTGVFQFLEATPGEVNRNLTGLEELDFVETDVLVYPNPFTDKLNISFSSLDKVYEITIFNQLGEIVRTLTSSSNFAGSTNIIWDGLNNNLEPISKGVYYLRISDGESAIVKPIMYIGN